MHGVFPADELARVKHTGGPRTRRPRAMGLFEALTHAEWHDAGFEVRAVLPRSYYEGPLWGIADGMGLRPEAVLGFKGRGKLSKRKFQKALSRRERRRKKQEARHRRAVDQVTMNSTVARLEHEGEEGSDRGLVASVAEAATSSAGGGVGFGMAPEPKARKARRAATRREKVEEEGSTEGPPKEGDQSADLVSAAGKAHRGADRLALPCKR